jgi:hypothetical protein
MADADATEKLRQSLIAALGALGPSPAAPAAPAAAPAAVSPQSGSTAPSSSTPTDGQATTAPASPKKRTILQTPGSLICTDCDSGQQLLVGDPNAPDELIRGINQRHKHGDLLSCRACRPALISALMESGSEKEGYEVRTDEGPGGELRIVPKRK